jgi:hypothetical protein
MLLPLLAPGWGGERDGTAQSLATIAGTVTLTQRQGAPIAASAYGRRDVAPRAANAAPETSHVVIHVDGVKPPSPPPPGRARIAQRNEQFHPQVLAVTAGTTVDFPNDDPYFHNVFSLSRAATFDLGRYRSGQSRSRTLTKPGIVKVFCHLHAQMSAAIVVFDHPWFAIPAADGTFAIRGIPPGAHTVVAWHERIGERRERLQLTPGATARVAFTLPVLEPEK